MSKRQPVAFVLSGGASLGAIQVGMLRALYERGIVADLVLGTSAGAFNAAFIASRPQTVQTADDLGAVWRGLTCGQVFPLNPLTGLLGFLGSRDHLVPDSGLRRLLSRHLEHERLEDMPLPLHTVAVDVITGEELRLSAGSAVDAVMASAAIPALLPPVLWEDRELMDGAVANDTPISHAVELGAREIYVLPTGHACALEESPHGALAMALHALSLLMHRRLIDDLDKHKDESKLVVLPPPCPLAIPPVDFGHAEALIGRSYADACKFLDHGGAARPPIRMRMHRHDTKSRKKREARVASSQISGAAPAGEKWAPPCRASEERPGHRREFLRWLDFADPVGAQHPVVSPVAAELEVLAGTNHVGIRTYLVRGDVRSALVSKDKEQDCHDQRDGHGYHAWILL